MDTLRQDIRYAVRTLMQARGFTAAAVLALALGIGANTAIFSVLSASLLRSMPYPQSEQLVVVWGEDAVHGEFRSQVSATDVADFRAMNHVFSEITTFGTFSGVLSGAGAPERIRGTQVGDNFFQILGVQPMLGRAFLPGEQVDGNDRVLILSYRLWQSHFGGDARIVGRNVTLSGRAYQVVGVMPANFQPLPATLEAGHDFYRPVAERYDETQRSARHLRALARLKPGVTLHQAQTEMAAITAKLAALHPQDNLNTRARVVRLADDTYHSVRPMLLVLFGAVMLVLLIACANVANLLLARSSTRRKEMAIRAALGASRSRIVRQVLTESAVLAIAAGVAGVLLAVWTTAAANSVMPKIAPQFGSVRVDARVCLYAMAMSLLTAMMFGLAPALQLAASGVSEQLKQGGRSASASGGWTRAVLVAGELAIALVLLVGASLLIRSFRKLLEVDPGFDARNRVALDLSLPAARYKDTASAVAFAEQVERAVGSLPGVRGVGLVSTAPFLDFDRRAFTVEGRPYQPGQAETADAYFTTPGYIAAMGIRTLRGRLFDAHDTAGAPKVAIVSQSTADHLWPGQDAVGKRIQLFNDANGVQRPPQTVVGIVADVKQYGLDGQHYDEVYLPGAQAPYFSGGTLVVETAGDPVTTVPDIKQRVQALDPDLALGTAQRLQDIVADSVLARRVAMIVLIVFAALAFGLGWLGIYSVIAYAVRQRTREIGIRMALGARPADVARMVMRQGAVLAASGILVGLIAATALTRLMTSLLFGVSPTDAGTFLAVAAALALAAMAASYIPARRATRVDPMVALRYE